MVRTVCPGPPGRVHRIGALGSGDLYSHQKARFWGFGLEGFELKQLVPELFFRGIFFTMELGARAGSLGCSRSRALSLGGGGGLRGPIGMFCRRGLFWFRSIWNRIGRWSMNSSLFVVLFFDELYLWCRLLFLLWVLRVWVCRYESKSSKCRFGMRMLCSMSWMIHRRLRSGLGRKLAA